ncbi:MAG: TetR/AcrR family transcriptional regulator [Planctomycetota bacterium]|nr:TetR/AcrR family transcriptional regulator [Planctomycetota bacterium]
MSATSPKRRSSAEIKEQIISEVVSLLWDHPLRDVTVKMIMEGTGLSRPAFYIHFDSIAELIEERLAVLEELMVGATLQWLSTTDENPETLRSALRDLIEVVVENGATFRAIAEAATLDARLAKTWADFMGQWDAAVAARIRVGQELGYFADVDPEWTAFAINRMDSTVLIEAFGRKPQQDPDTILETIFQIWQRTLYASK